MTVLIHTDEVIGASMAGPGMRAWRMAEALAGQGDVVLYTSAGASVTSDQFRVLGPEWGSLAEALEGINVVVHQGGSVLAAAPHLLDADSDVVVVADLYGVWLFEQQEQRRSLGRPGDLAQEAILLDVLNVHLRRADHILCASERQRALWIGHLVALGRISHQLYDADPALKNLITIVPFGLEGEIPENVDRRVKGVLPGIAATDKVILWGGGIHDWFDPLTLIRAMALLAPKRPNARLLFLGTSHPNPNLPPMQMVARSRELADQLGLLGTSVLFNDGWVPLAERAGYFADSDVGVSIHHESLETEFSFRTRMLDFLWAGLPIVATRGDVFSDIVVARQLGVTVGDGDVTGLAAALELLLYDDVAHGQARRNVLSASHEFSWAQVLLPFVELIARAAVAPGRLADSQERQRADVAADRLVAETHAKTISLERQLDDALSEVASLRRELSDFRGSTSWRITAPLRRGVDRVRGTRPS